MFEFIVFMFAGYLFFEYALPKIRRKFNKNVKEPTPLSYMFLEYFTVHRKMLVFTVFLAFLGMLSFGGIVLSNIMAGFSCYTRIINDEPMLNHSGICGFMQWIP